MLGGAGYKSSPSHYMSVLRDSLQPAASPNNNTMASTAIGNARDLANSLNTTTLAVQKCGRRSTRKSPSRCFSSIRC